MIRITTVSGTDQLEKKLNELESNPQIDTVQFQVLRSLEGRRPEFIVEYIEVE